MKILIGGVQLFRTIEFFALLKSGMNERTLFLFIFPYIEYGVSLTKSVNKVSRSRDFFATCIKITNIFFNLAFSSLFLPMPHLSLSIHHIAVI